jgi:hypothetical protein
MCGELGYAAAYVHLFYVLSCVERYVDFSHLAALDLNIPQNRHEEQNEVQLAPLSLPGKNSLN